MILAGARIALDAQRSCRADLAVQNGRLSLDPTSDLGPVVDLSGCLLLPGLINAHDHLEFNLFPRLGVGSYANAKSWAEDVYRPAEDPVRKHLAVPKRVRLFWGGIKNLLSGVTTVANHNPYEPTFDDEFPVRVLKRFGWAHSLDFESEIADRFRATPDNWPFILHAAEGTDGKSKQEIQRLDEMGVLTDHTVLVHGVGIDRAGLDLLRERGTSLVWCPTSNLSLLGRTLDVAALQAGIDIAIGTDSAISAQSSLVEEVQAARSIAGLTANEAYEMVTSRPSRLLRLEPGQGSLLEGGPADLVAVEDRRQPPAEALAELAPRLALVGGRFHLVSEDLRERVESANGEDLHGFQVDGVRWFTDLDVPRLYDAAVAALGDTPLLAGRRVSV